MIIFAPDRKQARLTAIDILLQAAADDKPKRFVQVRPARAQPRFCGTELETALHQGDASTFRPGLGGPV